MNQPVTVPEGKELVVVKAPGHTRVRIVDASGAEVFASAAEGSRVDAILPPGSYTVESDGKNLEVVVSALDPRHRGVHHDPLHPPPAPKLK